MNAHTVLHCVLTCPSCGHAKCETMPTDACQFFYECESCRTLLRPLRGDCCVFCSFGSTKCPPMQQSVSCCARSAELPANEVEAVSN
ncbi:MAG: GDCCVxC domain-containing (seleno)protein [Caldimonas sp.]